MTTLVIARVTVMDLIRRRTSALLMFFAGALILFSMALGEVTIGQWTRLITDVSLAAVDLSLTLLAIFMGSSLISGELERRSCTPVLAKPLLRGSFVTGRFLGLSVLLVAFSVLMVALIAFTLLLAKAHGTFVGPLIQNSISIAMGCIVVAGVAVLFSTLTSTTLAAFATTTVVLGGHLISNLEYFGGKTGAPVGKWVLLGAAKLLPNLEALNLKDLGAHGEVLDGRQLAGRLAYGCAYATAAVILGGFAFSKRDLK